MVVCCTPQMCLAHVGDYNVGVNDLKSHASRSMQGGSLSRPRAILPRRFVAPSFCVRSSFEPLTLPFMSATEHQ